MPSTSTLLRPPTIELEVLMWSRQLQKTRFDDYVALRFLSNAIFSLRAAQSSELGPTSRCQMALEGIYALCLGSIYLHGLLPLGQEGHRELVIQVATELMGLPMADRHQILAAKKQLEALTCDTVESLDEQDVRYMGAIGHKALSQAQHVYPDWFE